MSRHPSLKTSGKIRKRRNVLKRYERINMLIVSSSTNRGCAPLKGTTRFFLLQISSLTKGCPEYG